MTFPKTRNWRFNARYVALALLAMSVSACSLEERKTARVVIDLSELRADRAASSRWAASSLNATAMSTPAQPTWGSGSRALTTPLTSYDQLHCVMLNVMGEGIPSARPDMPATRPENWDQNKICSYVYPGTYSIPTSINQTTIELSVSVQKGPARLVQLIGFKNPTGLSCEEVTLPMLMSDGAGKERYELGKTKVDLMSDTTVEIQGNIASAKPMDGCRGLQNGGGGMSNLNSGYLFIGGRVDGEPTYEVDRFVATQEGGGFEDAPDLIGSDYIQPAESPGMGVTEVGGAVIRGINNSYAIAVGGRTWTNPSNPGVDIAKLAYLSSSATAWSYLDLPKLNDDTVPDRRRGAAVVSLGDSAWVIGGSAQAPNPILKIAEGGSGPTVTSLPTFIGVAAHGLLGAVLKNANGTRIIATGGCHTNYEVATGGCDAPQTNVIVINPTTNAVSVESPNNANFDTARIDASLSMMPDGSAVYYGGIYQNSLRNDFVVISATSTGIQKDLKILQPSCQSAQRYRHIAVPLGGNQLAILGGVDRYGALSTDGFVVNTSTGDCVNLGPLYAQGNLPNGGRVTALGPGMKSGSAWLVGSSAAPALFVQSGLASDWMWNIKFAIDANYNVIGLATQNGVSYDNRMQINATPQAGPGARDSYLPLQF